MNLNQLGWRTSFDMESANPSNEHLIPARVFRQDRQRYTVHDGESFRSATLLGRLLHESDDQSLLPAVGDWVEIQRFDDEALIHSVLPRFSVFYRNEAGRTTRQQVIAANIDTVFIVTGLDNDFNVRRIERYLVQTVSSGATPVIVLNKADLCSSVDTYVSEVERIASGLDVVSLSAKDNVNIEGLRTYLHEGSTIAFLGSSGVGKSSLINCLLGDEYFQTGTIREDDSRGRHTTTHRELVAVPGGGLVIDTPGLRELQLWSSEEDLNAVFGDIEVLARKCRFNDCRHESEPDCAVRQAIEDGELDLDRFRSHQKLRKELAFLETRQNESAAIQAKTREKHFGKMMKEMKRFNPKR